MDNVNVVLHIDSNEEGRLTLALKNIKNLLNEVDHTRAFINLVMNGPSVLLFRSLSIENLAAIEMLVKKNVRICACNNSLNNTGLGRDELPEGCLVVAAGILELIDLQNNKGCAYIKP